MRSTHRARWAAIGAAVAVSLGAGGFGLVSATVDSGERAVFVPITPCRLFDTRPLPQFNIGPKNTPFGNAETVSWNVRGTNGQCADIPADAVGVSLNVTALDATAPTFLTLWPTGSTQPNASSLNPIPGAPPTPNAVTTDLNNDGAFSIYNYQGSVHVLADVIGYYVDHNHDDAYYTKAQSDAATAKQKFISLDVMSMWLRPGMASKQNQNMNSGIELPHAMWPDYEGFATSFVLPPDFTPSSKALLKLYWKIAQTGCTVALAMNTSSWYRAGRAADVVSVYPNTAMPATATANQVTVSEFTVDAGGAGLAPGDAVVIEFYRPVDGCWSPLLITGASLTYQ